MSHFRLPCWCMPSLASSRTCCCGTCSTHQVGSSLESVLKPIRQAVSDSLNCPMTSCLCVLMVCAGSEYRLQVGNLQLDDLEAGSLRGQLTSAALDANVEARQGAHQCLLYARLHMRGCMHLCMAACSQSGCCFCNEFTSASPCVPSDGHAVSPFLLRMASQLHCRPGTSVPANVPKPVLPLMHRVLITV